ncbi:acylase [Kamptonema sp. UHCC 0994]|uniref:acylase n=1 Tax=Kamptonema sp. UHCC 0994 TaxID=3031329 RepID=UPI0023BA311E|nr:acylase [Kamptonema sp. UHCC 0994]MDF0552718.1 acylase [Kamptonema sp. UHCC 0994]
MFANSSQLARFKSKSSLLLPFIFGLIIVLFTSQYSFAIDPNRAEILWDTYGIPHVYAQDTKSLFRAFGWAQMQSHGNLILRLYGQARGRAAEYWGEKYLESDRWVRMMGIPIRAESWYDAQNPTFRSYLDAFAAGINSYAEEHGDRIDDELKAVLPINGVDLLAHTQRVLNFTFVVNPQQVKGINDRLLGSNGWAIAPSHSATGNAMLLANPHLPWSDLFLWFESQLTAPGINAYGASLVGIPVLTIAFNDSLGWTHTVNRHDGWDTYELTLADSGYRLDGKIQAFETEAQILKVKQDGGSQRSELLTVLHSIYGPVVAQKDGKAVALRVVGLDRPGALEEWWNMARSHNLSEFEAAIAPLQIPMFTVLYADRDGHIMHLFNGQVPKRPGGDFKYWQGVIPGDTSSTLWTKIHPYQDLPRAIDPPSGWLQNANDPPWTTTFPQAIDPDRYPPYMSSRGPMSFRAQRSARMLIEDEKISFEEMIEYKHSTRMELADRLLDDLIGATQQQDNKLARRAADVLAVWDRKADADSRGAVLFAAWVQEMGSPISFAIPWNEDLPMTTPDGLADPAAAVKALAAAASKVEAAYGALDVPWGDVFRLQSDATNLPASGGPSNLGIFRVFSFATTKDNRFRAVEGDSYVAVVEFSNPVRAMVLTSYGNSTMVNSAQSGEQLQLLASQGLRPVWRSRTEIESHLAKREVFSGSDRAVQSTNYQL